jgi:uncharacterized protein YgbK (DUF1537 family)
MKLLIIADDLSGAADCAVGFAAAGYRTVVTLDATHSAECQAADVVAVDTDSRRLAPADAAGRTAAAYEAWRVTGQRLYKKIDSTLRGNWAAEVAALQRLAGLAIVAPAFPATGRTLEHGRVLVNGMPLEDTDTWRLENEGRRADVASMLAEAGLTTESLDAEALHDQPEVLAARIVSIAASGVQALIVDTQTEAALRTLAQVTVAGNGAWFWVGSGGLAREIASVCGRKAVVEQISRPHPSAPVLILVGSLSTVSDRQCAMLRGRGGVTERIVPPALLREGPLHEGWPLWQEQIGATLSQGSDLLLRIGRDDAFDPADGVRLSQALAELVAPHITKAGGLIATGGETARAVLTSAGIGGLQLVAEVEAGVAIARPLGENRTHRPGIVTKAGAFGTDRALYAAWLCLRSTSEPNAT